MIPKWLEDLKQRIAGAFHAPASLVIEEIRRDDAPVHLELAVSPSVRSGGSADNARLMFDLLALSKLLDKTHVIAVDGGACGNAPEICLLGMCRGHRLSIRVLLAPPDNFQPMTSHQDSFRP